MAKKTIYVPDIECGSCVKLLDKKLHKFHGVETVVFDPDSLSVTYDETQLKPEQIIESIQQSGFRASFEPFERKTLKERMRHFKEKPHNYAIEMNGISYTLFLFLILSVLEILAYLGIFKTIPNFGAKYFWWLLYLNIFVASLAVSIWHFYSYKGKVTCMTGMMVGMTFGMQTGMMIGAIIGATNGFFVGAMVGMFLGFFIGAVSGACCGIMGILQGMMMGVMGGTMGPMIILMMFSDHLMVFMPFYVMLNVIIMLGLSYLVYEEVVEGKQVEKKPLDFMTLASFVVIATFILVLIMVYGPKSVLLT